MCSGLMVSIAAKAAPGRRTEMGSFLAAFWADAIPEAINVTPTIRLGRKVRMIRRTSRMNTRLLTKAEMKESVHIVRDGGGKRGIPPGRMGMSYRTVPNRETATGLRPATAEGGCPHIFIWRAPYYLALDSVLSLRAVDHRSVRPIALGPALSGLAHCLEIRLLILGRQNYHRDLNAARAAHSGRIDHTIIRIVGK